MSAQSYKMFYMQKLKRSNFKKYEHLRFWKFLPVN